VFVVVRADIQIYYNYISEKQICDLNMTYRVDLKFETKEIWSI